MMCLISWPIKLLCLKCWDQYVPHCLRKQNHMQAGEIWHSEVQCVMRSFSQPVRFFTRIMHLDMLHSNAFWITKVSPLMLPSAEAQQRLKEVCSNYCQIFQRSVIISMQLKQWITLWITQWIFVRSLNQVYVSILETCIVYSPFGTGTCGVSGLQVVNNFITFRIIAQILMLKINNLHTPLNNEYIWKSFLITVF